MRLPSRTSGAGARWSGERPGASFAWALGAALSALAVGGVALDRAAGAANRSAPPSVAADREPAIERAASAEEQLARARRARTSALRAPIARRAALRRVAAYSFRAVRQYFPGDRELAAEAGFRAAGEFLQCGAEDEALAEFERLVAPDAPATWRCRAWLELGHLRRRKGRLDEALDAYLRAASSEGAPRAWRDEASLWAGKTHEASGDVRQARRLFAWMTEHSADVFTRIRAFDEWALSFVGADDLEAAAGVLELCRTATREIAFEQTARGERVRQRLDAMRCIAELERAVRRRGAVDRRTSK